MMCLVVLSRNSYQLAKSVRRIFDLSMYLPIPLQCVTAYHLFFLLCFSDCRLGLVGFGILKVGCRLYIPGPA